MVVVTIFHSWKAEMQEFGRTSSLLLKDIFIKVCRGLMWYYIDAIAEYSIHGSADLSLQTLGLGQSHDETIV